MPHHDDPRTAPTAVPVAEERSDPALRGTQALLARIEADEAAATAARVAFERDGLPALVAEGAIAAELRHGERLHAIREGVQLNRHDGGLPGYGGTLYLTSSRLVHIGQATFSVTLDGLSEIAVVGERLLVALSHGEGFSIDVPGPRLLRVQIGMARNRADA